MSESLIKIQGIKKTYLMGETIVPALRGVTLNIEAGEFVAIMGPSGSGKSTLMHLLGLLDVPEAGSYKLLGREVSGMSEDDLAFVRNQTLGFVFQQFNLLARTSALENVSLPLIYTDGDSSEEWPKKLLEQVGLGGRIHHKPNELSGGQQQRVAIARALVNKPRIIFADEPTGNLDSTSQHEIMGIFKNLNEQGMTIILVTHEEEVAQYASRVIRMRDGLVNSDARVPQGESARGGTATLVRAPKAQEISAPPASRTQYSFGEACEHFKQAYRALTANKVRTGLSMLGILIGVGAVIAMLALGAGAKESIEKSLASMGTNLLVLRQGPRRSGGVSQQSGEGARITVDDAANIAAQIEGVRKVSPTVQGRAQIVFGNKNWNTQVQGAGVDYESMRASKPVLGRFFTAEENQSRSRVALVGQTVVRELFGESNPVGEMIKINRINFQVIGILPPKGATGWRDMDDIVIIPVNTAMRRLLGKDYLDSLDIEAADQGSMAGIQEQVLDLMAKWHRLPPSQKDAFEVRNMADLQAALSETSKTMSWLLGAIAAVSLLVGGIGIMNIMLVSVTERTREIGLRKALGARRADILSQFLIEAVVVSAAGGILGILFGAGISFLLSKFAGWATSVSGASVLLATLFSTAVGVGFGFWPARKAAALNPIEALRYE